MVFLALIGVNLSVPPSGIGVPSKPATMPLCNPPLAPEGIIEGNFNFGDGLFRAGKYRLAAKAYYQLFYCLKSTELNPHVSEDPKLYDAFQAAVALAAAGAFSPAAAEMKRIKKQLPPFTEAGYLAGLFAWAAGHHVDARRSLEDTLGGTHFAIPDDSPDIAQTAARRMLKWSYSLR
jgi:hypothetical protein